MMSNGKRFLLVLGAVVVLVGVPPLAQERKGGIRGHVTDNSGGILQGARIELQPKGIIVVSNTQGEFFIKDVDPGSFTISITYVGFNGFTKQVTVSAGQIASLDAKLEVGSQNLEVLVTAGRASGEAEEINRQLTADNLVRSEEHTSELQSPCNLVCRLLLEKKKKHMLLHLLELHKLSCQY